jgi:hypothetical protein
MEFALSLLKYGTSHRVSRKHLHPCVAGCELRLKARKIEDGARLAAVKYGARDEKAGALGSVYDIGRDGRLNHRIEVRGGVMESECAAIVRDFFQRRRAGTPPG